MMCQTCIDDGSIANWLADIVAAHEAVYDDGYEGGHIVIADWNIETHHIRFCLDQNEQPMGLETRKFLKWLLTIPEAERVPSLLKPTL